MLDYSWVLGNPSYFLEYIAFFPVLLLFLPCVRKSRPGHSQPDGIMVSFLTETTWKRESKTMMKRLRDGEVFKPYSRPTYLWVLDAFLFLSRRQDLMLRGVS